MEAFDWSELAFGSKKQVNGLGAIFIAAPRQLSAKRFTELVKQYLPAGNILLGLAKEDYVLGLEDQPQFKVLKASEVQAVINKVNSSASRHKIYVLKYSQRELIYILEKLILQKVVLVNGSWYHAFHHKPEFYFIVNNKIPYEKVSPFTDQAEAKGFAKKIKLPKLNTTGTFSESGIMELVNQAARQSYDYGGHQTAVVLAKRQGSKYRALAVAHNKVVPYETYAMHFGSTREQYFSPLNDLNHYDTVHAEVELVVKAQKEKILLNNTSLFINLLPCPTCARMFVETDIEEFVYTADHSSGYAIKMLEAAGKKVRRLAV